MFRSVFHTGWKLNPQLYISPDSNFSSTDGVSVCDIDVATTHRQDINIFMEKLRRYARLSQTGDCGTSAIVSEDETEALKGLTSDRYTTDAHLEEPQKEPDDTLLLQDQSGGRIEEELSDPGSDNDVDQIEPLPSFRHGLHAYRFTSTPGLGMTSSKRKKPIVNEYTASSTESTELETNKRRQKRPGHASRAANMKNTSPRRFTVTTAINSPAVVATTASPSVQHRPRGSGRGYVPPETFAHLNHLPDVLEPGLIAVFIGTNPGLKTAGSGHAYAHPSNHFWKMLHYSGCTTRRCAPEEDRNLPKMFSLGNTNLVSRPTKDQGQLSLQEMEEGTAILEAKIRRYRPTAVCILGKGIWKPIWKARYGRNLPKGLERYGWQDPQHNLGISPKSDDGDGDDDDWPGARVFLCASTSGLVTVPAPAEKMALWKEFGDWVVDQRNERQLNIKEEDRNHE